MVVPATPDPENLSLGAGKLLFDRFDAAGASTGYRHLGNVESLSLTTTVETVEKRSSMDGARGILKEAVVGTEGEWAAVLNEYDVDNLALALLGDTAVFSQSSSSGLLAQPVNGGNAISFDRWYQLELSAGGDAKQVSALVVKQGAATLVLNTDYLVDLEVGMILIKSDGGGTEVVTTWEGDIAAITSTKIRGLSVGKIEGRLRYVSASDQAAGPRFEVDVHKISIRPDGELPWITEDFAAFTLRGRAQKDITKPAGEEFYTARKL